MMRRVVPALALGLLVACAPKSQVVRLGEPGGPEVVAGRYPGRLRLVPAPDPLFRRSLAWQQDASAHEDALRRAARSRYSIKGPLEFRFKYTAVDTAAAAGVVRYFSFAADQTVIAGWEVLLVYGLARGNLLRAYVNEVPLE